MGEPDSLEHKRAILEYWTLVEFFSPYILENTLDNKQSYQKIYADEPISEPLPWLNAQTIEENDPKTPFAKGYHLYLGLFSIEETADRARHSFRKTAKLVAVSELAKLCTGKLYLGFCKTYSNYPWYPTLWHTYSFYSALGTWATS